MEIGPDYSVPQATMRPMENQFSLSSKNPVTVAMHRKKGIKFKHHRNKNNTVIYLY